MSTPCSISQSDTIITVASWEERFRLGLENIKQSLTPKRVIIFYYYEYEQWSKENREAISKVCSSDNCSVIESRLYFNNSVKTWKTIASSIQDNVINGELVTLDISTMPREAIWIISDCLRRKKCDVQYIYNKPMSYAEDWLSRDPERPRFVFRLSGISRLDAPTTLLVITGFDSERTKQLVRYYEPRNLIIGLQSGEQYENLKKNREEHIKAFHRNKEIRWFDVDGYDLQATIRAVEFNLQDSKKNRNNIILSSLGPKISALALYKYHMDHENTALAYAPSKEFNKEYSKGLSETLCGYLFKNRSEDIDG